MSIGPRKLKSLILFTKVKFWHATVVALCIYFLPVIWFALGTECGAIMVGAAFGDELVFLGFDFFFPVVPRKKLLCLIVRYLENYYSVVDQHLLQR